MTTINTGLPNQLRDNCASTDVPITPQISETIHQVPTNDFQSAEHNCKQIYCFAIGFFLSLGWVCFLGDIYLEHHLFTCIGSMSCIYGIIPLILLNKQPSSNNDPYSTNAAQAIVY